MKPLQLVFRYTRNYTWQLAITVISMLLLVGVQLTLPWIVKTLIEAHHGKIGLESHLGEGSTFYVTLPAD